MTTAFDTYNIDIDIDNSKHGLEQLREHQITVYTAME